MLWAHAYGRSMGYLRVLWSRGCKIPYVNLTGSVRFTCGHHRGPCGLHAGMRTSVRSVLPSDFARSVLPSDFARVYTCLALTGPVDCPRASCDLGIKCLMLRSHA